MKALCTRHVETTRVAILLLFNILTEGKNASELQITITQALDLNLEVESGQRTQQVGLYRRKSTLLLNI